jgi:hypothetical protein
MAFFQLYVWLIAYGSTFNACLDSGHGGVLTKIVLMKVLHNFPMPDLFVYKNAFPSHLSWHIVDEVS